ncbi:MAG: hypothetical protein LAO78_23045 [Acidobacteriia bacterium]|nr:hypothetical protein [Terriglobia bacterium]
MKTERTLRVPSLTISVETADKIIAELHKIAEEKMLPQVEQRLRTAYKANPAEALRVDPGANDENSFVARNLDNQTLRGAMNLDSAEKYAFLSPNSNVQFDNPTFQMEDLPKDVFLVICRADGINRFIEIKLRSQFKDFNDLNDKQANQILIQGSNAEWVNATYQNFQHWIDAEKRRTRNFVYQNSRPLFWLSMVLVCFGEYAAAKLVNPAFNLQAPLSGTGALLMFGVLLATLIVGADLCIRLYIYWFPYFEIDTNLSRARTEARTLVKTFLIALYTFAVLNAAKLMLASALKRWFN